MRAKLLKIVSKFEWIKLSRLSLGLLDKRSRTRVYLAVLLLAGLAMLDILAIGFIGLLSLMTLNGITTGNTSQKVNFLLDLLNINNFSFQLQAATLAFAIATILILRTYISAIVNKRMLGFLSLKSVEISKQLLNNIFSRDALRVKTISRSNINYGLTEGVDRIVVGVLGSVINIGGDFFLISSLIVSLIFVDVALGLTSFVFFGMIGAIIYIRQGKTAAQLGRTLSSKRVEINDKLFAVIDSVREVQLRGTLPLKLEQISNLRVSQSKAWAQMSFQPFAAKYFLEIGMVLGAVIVAGTQFLAHDAKHAVSLLSFFLATGFRIIPAILRLQSSLITIRSSSSLAAITLDLLKLPPTLKSNPLQVSSGSLKESFTTPINFSDVSFKYSDESKWSINNLNFQVEAHKLTAIVGPSGSGKSTVFDLALGFSSPRSGSITIEGVPAGLFVSQNPGMISLVPQVIHISKESLRENLLLGYNREISDETLIEILDSLGLGDLVEALPEGLDSGLGEFGSRLSGGQRQRIGIARAVCTSPKFLFLDEATSSLDALTEQVVMRFLTEMKSRMTIVVIAHRLSTVRTADCVAYLENGKILSSGSFDDVRRNVPNFERQAGLMGIN